MLGIPRFKEVEKHVICPECDKPQYEGLGEQAKGSPGFCLEDQARKDIPVKMPVNKDKTEFTEQTQGLNGDIKGK